MLEEKNRNESLSSYTSMVSHEFRTPIATSLMFLQQLQETTTDPHSMFILRLVINSLIFLLCLVNDMIDIKNISVNRFMPKFEVFEPLSHLELIVETFRL